MSSDNLGQICVKNTQGNNQLTKQLVMAIRRQIKTSKQVAGELVISTERVRNWYYRNTGMTALDLLLLMGEYNFVRDFIDAAVVEYGSYKTGVLFGACCSTTVDMAQIIR